MTSRILSALSAPLILCLAQNPALADDHMGEETKTSAATIEPQIKSRNLAGTFGGVRVPYTATIGETILKGEDGTQEAVIVTTSYVKSPRASSRPVFFIYNRGPG